MNPSLNSFRFFAFLAVFLFHIGHFSAGYLGVQAFFVLSGFLITPILVQTKERSSNLASYLKNFLTRRFLRIFPLYYAYLVGILLTISVFELQQHTYFASLKGQLVYAFTYTYNIYHQTIYWEHNKFLTHFWSLAVEEQFYVFWPFLIYFTSRTSLQRVLVCICILGPLIRFCLGLLVDQHTFDFVLNDRDQVVYLSTFSHLDAFAIGGLCGLLPKFNVSNRTILIAVGSTVVLGFGVSAFFEHDLRFDSLGYPDLMKGSLRYIWGYSVLNVCFAAILIGLRRRTFIPYIFENRTLAALGLVSYGCYVYHFGVIWIVQFLRTKAPFLHSSVVAHLVALAITVLISYLSFHLFERKFIEWKDRLAPKHASDGY